MNMVIPKVPKKYYGITVLFFKPHVNSISNWFTDDYRLIPIIFKH